MIILFRSGKRKSARPRDCMVPNGIHLYGGVGGESEFLFFSIGFLHVDAYV